MEQVYQKTRELGEAIMNCYVYKEMKQAEEAALKNEQAEKLTNEYIAHRHKLEELMQQNNPDSDQMSEESRAMEELQAQLNQIEELVTLSEKRNEFTALINQVNRLLKFVLTGEMDDEDGCTGSCETCGGCH